MLTVAMFLGYLFFSYCMSLVLEHGGQKAWWAYVPLLNLIGLLRAVGFSSWWILLVFVPGANLILHIVVWMRVARRFERGVGFGIGLTLLTVIFLPILAFSLPDVAPPGPPTAV